MFYFSGWLTNLWWTVWGKLQNQKMGLLVIIYDIYLKIGYPIPSAGWSLFSSLKWPCLAPNEHQVCHQQQCIHLLSLPPLAGLNVVRSQRPRWFKAQVLQVDWGMAILPKPIWVGRNVRFKGNTCLAEVYTSDMFFSQHTFSWELSSYSYRYTPPFCRGLSPPSLWAHPLLLSPKNSRVK